MADAAAAADAAAGTAAVRTAAAAAAAPGAPGRRRRGRRRAFAGGRRSSGCQRRPRPRPRPTPATRYSITHPPTGAQAPRGEGAPALGLRPRLAPGSRRRLSWRLGGFTVEGGRSLGARYAQRLSLVLKFRDVALLFWGWARISDGTIWKYPCSMLLNIRYFYIESWIFRNCSIAICDIYFCLNSSKIEPIRRYGLFNHTEFMSKVGTIN